MRRVCYIRKKAENSFTEGVAGSVKCYRQMFIFSN